MTYQEACKEYESEFKKLIYLAEHYEVGMPRIVDVAKLFSMIVCARGEYSPTINLLEKDLEVAYFGD